MIADEDPVAGSQSDAPEPDDPAAAQAGEPVEDAAQEAHAPEDGDQAPVGDASGVADAPAPEGDGPSPDDAAAQTPVDDAAPPAGASAPGGARDAEGSGTASPEGGVPGSAPEASQEPEAAPEASQESETAPEVSQEPDTAPASQESSETAPEASQESSETGPEASQESETAPEASQEPETAPASRESSETGPEASQEPDDAGGPAPRVKPSVPGAHLEVDIVPEGVDPLGPNEQYEDPYATEDELIEAGEGDGQEPSEELLTEPIATAAIDLAAGARYRATGKRKTAIARVTLRPGSGSYLVNGRSLEEHFPRATLQRNIRQPLETVGYQERMDVVARLHGGGISAQAGALRHGVSRALLEADPNLRGELKRRGFLTRDSRAKERKKAGLKKARKRPQFSKR